VLAGYSLLFNGVANNYRNEPDASEAVCSSLPALGTTNASFASSRSDPTLSSSLQAYLKATSISPDIPTAWQVSSASLPVTFPTCADGFSLPSVGSRRAVREEGRLEQARLELREPDRCSWEDVRVIRSTFRRSIADLSIPFKSEDSVKLAETIQKLIQLRRDQGTRAQVRSSIMFHTNSKLISYLSRYRSSPLFPTSSRPLPIDPSSLSSLLPRQRNPHRPQPNTFRRLWLTICRSFRKLSP
jgi:hypothetical protein